MEGDDHVDGNTYKIHPGKNREAAYFKLPEQSMDNGGDKDEEQ